MYKGTPRSQSSLRNIIIFIFGTIAIIFLTRAYNETQTQPPLPAQSQVETKRIQQEEAILQVRSKAELSICANSLNCWAKHHRHDAAMHCKPHIEAYAKFDVRWTNSWTESIFDRMSKGDDYPDQIVYFGDSVQFQNGFGAYQKIQYTCIYNTRNQTASALASAHN